MTKEKQVRKLVGKQMEHWRFYVVFSFFMAIGIRLIAMIPPFVMQKITDVYLPAKDWNNIFTGILVCVIVPLLSAMLTGYYNYKLNAAGRNMGAQLSLRAGEKLVYQPVSFFKDKNSAELASYCNSESMKYIVFWLFDVPELAASLCTGIMVFLYIATQSVVSGIALLFYIPVMLLPGNYFAEKAAVLIKRVVGNKGKSMQLLTDTFRGIKTVKATGTEQYHLKEIQKINQDTASVWGKVAALDNLSGMWTNSVADRLFTGIVFGILIVSITNGAATIGLLLAILNYLPLYFETAKKMTTTNLEFKKQQAEFERLFELILMEDEREKKSGILPFCMEKGITAENISFRYEEELPLVLDKASFSVKRGEWVGIVGESGAGKSTLFQLLIRFYEPLSGVLKIDGCPIEQISCEELRKNIVLVSQDTVLFPGTLRENLLMVKEEASEEELKDVLCKVGLNELLSREEGLDSILGENGLLLSGGQKQRIGLAQGLLKDSKVLLLDEVTANIDSKAEEEIRNTIAQLQKEKGITILSISHRQAFLDQADRVYEIKDGKIFPKKAKTH